MADHKGPAMRPWPILVFLLLLFPARYSVAADGAEQDRGFIEVAPSRRYFQWEDGTPFFPIGQNDWTGAFDLRKRSKTELDAYFRNLSDHGVNVLRLLVDVGVKQDVVWVETQPGAFNPRFKEWMDTIVELAEKHDVYLIVAFYPNLIGGPAGNWRFYPYSTTAGGTLDEPYDMVVSPTAIEYQKRRIRYFVDNWGASPHIFSWELFNEFWLPGKTRANKEIIAAHNLWIDQMGRYIKAYEMRKFGRHHLRSVSSMRSEFPEDVRGLVADDTSMFRSPQLDFASYHGYGRQLRGAQGAKTNVEILLGKRIEPERLIRSIHQTVGMMLERSPDRPVLCTEDFQFANPEARSYRNPLNPIRKMLRDYTDEQRHDLFLAANWSFIASGAAGPTMRYPMEYFEDEIYDGYEVVSRFAAMVPWQKFHARPAHGKVSTNRDDLIAMALSDGRVMIAWLYHNVPWERREPIQPTVEFLGLRNTASKVTWVDGRTGEVLRTDRVRGPSSLELRAPAFEGHAACVVEPAR